MIVGYHYSNPQFQSEYTSPFITLFDIHATMENGVK